MEKSSRKEMKYRCIREKREAAGAILKNVSQNRRHSNLVPKLVLILCTMNASNSGYRNSFCRQRVKIYLKTSVSVSWSPRTGCMDENADLMPQL